MPLSRLKVRTFRCLSDVEVELDARRNVIYGRNGAGKTSLLESLYILGRGRSFRTRAAARLVQHGADGFSVYGETTGRGDRIGVAFSARKLQVRLNGAPARGMAELASALIVHVIDPSAHELIEGGPSVRRRFFDAAVFHVKQSYLEAWRHYRRVLGQRNAALKAGQRGASLGVWTRELVAASTVIDRARRAQVDAIGAQLAVLGKRLMGRELTLEYRSGWRRGLDLAEVLHEAEARDRETGFTQLGPHRADVVVRMDGDPVRDVASRGQQKLIAAALLLAEVRKLGEESGQGGVLLVDDPAAELDAGALENLLALLDELPAQLVMTAISKADLPPPDGAALFHVEQGGVEAVV